MSESYSKAKVDKWLADFRRMFLIEIDDIERRHRGEPLLRGVLKLGAQWPNVKLVPDYEQMVAYWAWLAYNIEDGTKEVPYAAQLCVDEGELSLNETWEEMGRWERANVLFGLIPIINECASAVAQAAARCARENEE